MSLLMQTVLEKLQQLCSIVSNIKTAIALIENVPWGEAARLQFEARGTYLERQQQGGQHI